MIEIEQKYHRQADTDWHEKLIALGAVFLKETVERDQYWNAPDRDFAVTGEAFRVRTVGHVNGLTYKGPKLAGATVKVRTEHEIEIEPGPAGLAKIDALLSSLGYQPVAVVRKVRRSYQLTRDTDRLTVCLDDCETVGLFAEIEILADSTQQPAAIQQIHALAAELGLDQPEAKSYLRMVLERQGRS